MKGEKYPPTREVLDQMSTERVELYRRMSPEGLQVPLLVLQAEVDYSTPSKEEIEVAVKFLKGDRMGSHQAFTQNI